MFSPLVLILQGKTVQCIRTENLVQIDWTCIIFDQYFLNEFSKDAVEEMFQPSVDFDYLGSFMHQIRHSRLTFLSVIISFFFFNYRDQMVFVSKKGMKKNNNENVYIFTIQSTPEMLEKLS